MSWREFYIDGFFAKVNGTRMSRAESYHVKLHIPRCLRNDDLSNESNDIFCIATGSVL